MSFWDRRRSALVLVGLTLFHVLLISIQVPRGPGKSLFEQAIFFVFSPIQRVATGAVRGIGSLWSGYFDLRGVRAENEKLKREVFFLNQDVRFLGDRLRFARSEAEIRTNLAEFKDSIVVARVIGVDSANPYQSIIIDKGSLDGVRSDMAVCDRKGSLVGRTIAPISLKESMVQLVTDNDSSVSVQSAIDGLVGSMTGRSGGVCELRYVLASVSGGREGEELRTTGYDKIYPAGIRAGVIKSWEEDQASPIFRRIYITPAFDFAAIDVVAVLTKGPGGGA